MSLRLSSLLSFAIVLCLLFATNLTADAPYIDVLELTDANFQKMLDESQNILIKFHAPWCGFCKRLKPEYERLGTALKEKGLGGKMVLAEINCEAHPTACEQFSLRGYPTIKLFKAGKKDAPVDLPDDTPRTAEGLQDFLVAQVGIKPVFVLPETPVKRLSLLDFEGVVQNNKVLVKFFTPWCGACKTMSSTYEDLATLFRPDATKVLIAELDCSQGNNSPICDTLGIQSYPTLKFFDHSNVPTDSYRGSRDLSSLVDYVNTKAGLFRATDGSLLPHYARTPTLDALTRDFMTQKEKRSALLAEVQEIIKSQPEPRRYYATFMQRVLDKGDDFVHNELSRLTSIVSQGGVDSSKLDGFHVRISVLKVFSGEAEALMNDTAKFDHTADGPIPDGINVNDIFASDHSDL